MHGTMNIRFMSKHSGIKMLHSPVVAEEDQRTHGEERCSRTPKELIRPGWRSKLMPRIE